MRPAIFYPAILLAATALSAAIAPWPEWRGPARDGHAVSAPAQWPEKLKKGWEVPVGEGHASPITDGTHVWVFSREGDNEVLRCLTLASGQQVWVDRYPAPYEMNPAALRHGKGPKSTPLLADGRVYTLGITGILSAYEAAGGKLLWRKDFSKQFPSNSPLYGTATSPLEVGGQIIAWVGGHGSGALMAFDAKTGAVKWQWNQEGPGYASPIVATLAGVRQLVTQSQDHIAGFSLDGKQLWTMPFTTPYTQNIVTPLVVGDLLILSGHQQRTFAVRLQRAGSGFRTEEVWTNPLAMYMSSPVAAGGYVYGLSERNKGSLFAIEAKTGKTAWASPGRLGDNASVTVAGSNLAVLTTEGKLLIVPASPTAYEVKHEYEVAPNAVWAHLAIAGDRLLVKDADTLRLWTAR